MEKERVGSFEQMKVWQEAHALVLRVFELTPRLPPEQQDGLALQIERAAIDVPRSIAEGFRRRGPRNKGHFYNVAQSALEGLRYYFILCRDLRYDIDFDDLAYRADQISRMLEGLVRSMTRASQEGGRSAGRRRGGRAHGRERGGGVGERDEAPRDMESDLGDEIGDRDEFDDE